jgi:hypothetical protein
LIIETVELTGRASAQANPLKIAFFAKVIRAERMRFEVNVLLNNRAQ